MAVQAYVQSLTKIGVPGVKRLELAIRMKIDQKTSGGPMALRKAFKYFDADASGDIDPDEFFAAMCSFGLEFTEDQVLALFGYYDVDRDGGLSYYEFIEKVHTLIHSEVECQLAECHPFPSYSLLLFITMWQVLGSSFNLGGKKEPEYAVLQPMPEPMQEEAAVMRTTISKELLEESACRKVFERYDINKSGEIDLRELAQLVRSLGLSMDREQINNAMFDLDLNQNGTISFTEFWTWWQKKAPPARESGPPMMKSGTKSSTGMVELHDRVSQDMDRAQSKSRTGHWEGNGRPSSSLSNLGRPLSRNSMHTTVSMDFRQPPMVCRAPKVHNLGWMRRPHTAPIDSSAPLDRFAYSRTPDIPGVPQGQITGFRL